MPLSCLDSLALALGLASPPFQSTTSSDHPHRLYIPYLTETGLETARTRSGKRLTIRVGVGNLISAFGGKCSGPRRRRAAAAIFGLFPIGTYLLQCHRTFFDNCTPTSFTMWHEVEVARCKYPVSASAP